eukprot:TRINITY_DN3252_c0_g1_i6.p1 TRINITY_DN3252_c0_g1~~TRINITY_DN3252_c0_g1_i6.p1  ORF type:complete len:522 (-),score=151.80 TRINITY_DN3252_c0_g1_i6:364-1842(-)
MATNTKNNKKYENDSDEEDEEDAARSKILRREIQESEIPPKPMKNAFTVQVEALKSALKQKKDWERKIADPTIRARYIEEAKEQGADSRAIRRAIQELELFETDNDLTFEFKSVDSNLPIFHADGLIPNRLQKRVERHLDKLAAAEEKDWHPGSEKMVLDLIHPSMYPYIKGVSKRIPLTEPMTFGKPKPPKKKKEDDDEDDGEDNTRKKRMRKPRAEKKPKPPKKKKLKSAEDSDDDDDHNDDDEEEDDDDDDDDEEEGNGRFIGNYDTRDRRNDRFGRLIEKSKYQWLPAIYSVGSDGKVDIESYINNLDQEKYPEIYEDFEDVFELVLPMIERCIDRIEHLAPLNIEPYDSYYIAETLLSQANKEEENERLHELATIPRRYQVITKACNYVLKPGDVYRGKWHVEGMSHEHIIASALYYYSSSPGVKDQGLAFRAATGLTDNEYGPGDQKSWAGSVNLARFKPRQEESLSSRTSSNTVSPNSETILTRR